MTPQHREGPASWMVGRREGKLYPGCFLQDPQILPFPPPGPRALDRQGVSSLGSNGLPLCLALSLLQPRNCFPPATQGL